jgi:hypothetical protein
MQICPEKAKKIQAALPHESSTRSLSIPLLPTGNALYMPALVDVE